MSAKRHAPARRAIGAALAVALLLTACSSVPGAPPADSAAPTIEPATAWEMEVGNLEPDGSRSLDSALRLFSMAFGPLPGVAAAAADPGPILSGTPAVRAIRAHRDALTAEQLSAVDAYLTIPEDALLEQVPPASEASPAALAPLAAGLVAVDVERAFVDRVRATLADLRSRLAAEWGDFPNDIALYVIGSQETGAYTWYDADIAPLNPNQFACRIFVSGAGILGSDEGLDVALAHEVFHCGAAYKTGSKYSADLVPAWVWEGAAHYFAMQATSASFRTAWNRYVLEAASIPLFEREYDAIGFWSHIEYRFGGVYAAIASALRQGSNEERFVAAGGSARDFVNTWASGLFRDALGRQGRDWNTDGPGLSPVLSTPRQVLHVAAGDVEVVERAAYTNALYVVNVTTDLVLFEFVGHARLGDAAAVDTTALSSAVFCARADGCPPCPDDPDPKEYRRLAASPILAISGGMDGTSGTVSGAQLEPCDTPSPSPTEDEFCLRYRAYWSWAQAAGDDITREKSAEIERRFVDMRPYAPAQLVEYVDLMVLIYGTFARAPDPFQVPVTGQLPLERIPEALSAMHAHCGLPNPF